LSKRRHACCRVIATCRNPDKAAELQQLQSSSSGRLDIVQLDCTDEDSIANAASQVSGIHKHLDLLLNVAGILHVPGKMSPGQLQRRLLSMIMLTVSCHVGSWSTYCICQSSMADACAESKNGAVQCVCHALVQSSVWVMQRQRFPESMQRIS